LTLAAGVGFIEAEEGQRIDESPFGPGATERTDIDYRALSQPMGLGRRRRGRPLSAGSMAQQGDDAQQ
jgi:hypothetical protein